MNISPVNAYGYQNRVYVPRFQGKLNGVKNLLKKPYTEVLPELIKSERFMCKLQKPLKDMNPPKPAKPTEIPLKDTNIPKISKLTPHEAERNIENAGKTIKETKTGLSYRYDDNGEVVEVFDKNSKSIRVIYRNSDGPNYRYYDYNYDVNGNKIRVIHRNSDGSTSYYNDFIFDSNGKEIRTINRKADGSIAGYTDFITISDSNGKITREIDRKADGSVFHYFDTVYDSNGKITREIDRKADGSVFHYFDTVYDANGKCIRTIYHEADGTVCRSDLLIRQVKKRFHKLLSNLKHCIF